MTARTLTLAFLTACLATAGCHSKPEEDAQSTCQRTTPRSGVHGSITESFGSGLGQMAPMAARAVPGMGGVGGMVAGMGLRQTMSQFGLGQGSPRTMMDTAATQPDAADPTHTPMFPCQPPTSSAEIPESREIHFQDGG